VTIAAEPMPGEGVLESVSPQAAKILWEALLYHFKNAASGTIAVELNTHKGKTANVWVNGIRVPVAEEAQQQRSDKKPS
jgi:hypothetical protein